MIDIYKLITKAWENDVSIAFRAKNPFVDRGVRFSKGINGILHQTEIDLPTYDPEYEEMNLKILNKRLDIFIKDCEDKERGWGYPCEM